MLFVARAIRTKQRRCRMLHGGTSWPTDFDKYLKKQGQLSVTIWTSGPSILLYNYFHSSRRSWQFFWCDFSFVIRKVRDSAARKLKRGRKKKAMWEGRGVKAVKPVRKTTAFSPRLLPHRFLFRPWLSIRAAETFTLRTVKEKTHYKNCQLCRLFPLD